MKRESHLENSKHRTETYQNFHPANRKEQQSTQCAATQIVCLLFNFTGIWGSAFAILPYRVLQGEKLPDDTIEDMRKNGDLRDENGMLRLSDLV